MKNVLEQLISEFQCETSNNYCIPVQCIYLWRRLPPSLEKRKNIVWDKRNEQDVSKARIIKNGTSEKPGLLQKLLFFLLVTNIVPIFTKINEEPLLKLFAFCHKALT